MMAPRILITHGARATEERLLHDLGALLAPARRDLSLLRLPVRVVVPSVSLRNHLSAVLVRRLGSVVGCRVSTLHQVAIETAAVAGLPRERAQAFNVIVRRSARAERGLSRHLDDLRDGYRGVMATVRDFLDAGLEEVHAEALLEYLASEGRSLGTEEEIERAGAMLRIAREVQDALDRLDLVHRSTLYRSVRDALEAEGTELLPTRGLLVHGFSDATGVVTDLLETLLRTFAGTLYLDRPPSGLKAGAGYEAAFSARFLGRLSQVAGPEELDEAPPTPRSCELVAAPDPDAELREVGRGIRRLLGEGILPESIGVVARDLEAAGPVVRRQLRRLGIPFSALGATGPLTPAGRDLAALAELLDRGSSLPLERWLDLYRHPPGGSGQLTQTARSAIRLRLFNLGASRLRDAARITEVDREVEAARRLAADLESWSAAGDTSFEHHRRRLERVVDGNLGWTPDLEARERLESLLEALVPELPEVLTLGYRDVVLLLSDSLKAGEAVPLGGHGGGVQVLSAMEARGRTFEHLFLVGVDRDRFPRTVHEDPLLPDRLRRGIARLLPDLPVKAMGFDEERHLFAQLVSSAPHVVVSWPEQDTDGRTLAPSPLVDRLGGSPRKAPHLLAANDTEVRPLGEELLVRALHGGRDAFAELLPLATDISAARLRVLQEMDPDRGRRDGARLAHRLGPYFGFLGRIREGSESGEPRGAELFVTTLESLAACPWQTFLVRLLRLAPPPDPMASLPQLRGMLVGSLVHQVLERLGATAPRDRPWVWPAPARVEAVLAAEAEHLLREHGLAFKGLARAAAELARPYLEVVRRIDGRDRGPVVLAVEHRESLTLEDRGRRRPVSFQVDRVDRLGSGARLYTDFKTGRRPRPRRSARQSLREWIGAGEWLQVAAYVYGAPPEARGRYLFLRPDLDDGEREVTLSAADGDLRSVFESTVLALLRLWDEGVFFPRLIEADDDVEPPRCRSCQVAEACLRRDSGARGRLRRWTDELRARAAEGLDATFEKVWSLRARHGSPQPPSPTSGR